MDRVSIPLPRFAAKKQRTSDPPSMQEVAGRASGETVVCTRARSRLGGQGRACGTPAGRRATLRDVVPREPNEVLLELARRYADLLRQHFGDRLVSIVLFGSVARGDASAASDLDLLIVAEDLPQGQFARKRLLAAADAAFEEDLERAQSAGVDTRLARIIRTPDEAARPIPLYFDLTEDAVILHDRREFFAGVLDRLRASLRRLGARRVRQGAVWYWDLKPDFKPGDVVEI